MSEDIIFKPMDEFGTIDVFGGELFVGWLQEIEGKWIYISTIHDTKGKAGALSFRAVDLITIAEKLNELNGKRN